MDFDRYIIAAIKKSAISIATAPLGAIVGRGLGLDQKSNAGEPNMKKSTKAVLLSAFVFPGLGHIYLKRYLVGAVLLFAAAISVYQLGAAAIDTALSIAAEIEAGQVSLGETSISQLVEEKSAESAEATDLPLAVLALGWIIGLLDAYRVGKKVDKQQEGLSGKR